MHCVLSYLMFFCVCLCCVFFFFLLWELNSRNLLKVHFIQFNDLASTSSASAFVVAVFMKLKLQNDSIFHTQLFSFLFFFYFILSIIICLFLSLLSFVNHLLSCHLWWVNWNLLKHFLVPKTWNLKNVGENTIWCHPLWYIIRPQEIMNLFWVSSIFFPQHWHFVL